MKIDHSTAGNWVMQKIEHFNDRNEDHPFYVGDGITIDALLSMYNYSHEFFRQASAAHYTKTLYGLARSAILLRPEYSTDITSEEDKDEEREEWAGPVTVKLNVDQVGDLLFFIEVITDFLANMESESDKIKSLVKRYKMESLEKQLLKTQS